MSNHADGESLQSVARIEELIRAIESSADPAARDHVRALARAILELHRAGLSKLVELIAQAGEPGQRILDACDRDDLVRSLFLLHDLHPQALEVRVAELLARLGPVLLQHGAALELAGVAVGVVRLRNQRAPLTLPVKRLVEGALLEALPDVERIEFGEAPAHRTDPVSRTIPLPVLSEVGRPRP